ncbi:something about silencing protein 10-like [Solanum tuberosum]|uniref:something about silencing protein 10-like n=1 Tax=Solanum tuberosum TaxID=4113 RepID=UPI0003D26C19|nr:PREDICTED: something about silencing protein 10-like [Solanum tuberosum]XP_015158669.1 PREDICTED: something about silencing protein 10-like [Solanum tuberosum]XP_015158673.1 PREDICTED: something about silencing protein 10-like [Solanum tuberosum]
MGKKSGKFKKKENNPPKKSKIDFYNEDDDMMNDAIDAFHEKRDIIPLNVNEDSAESDEDNEHPVYDLKEDEDEEDEDDDFDDAELTGLGAKIARTQKYLQATMGGVEDEMHDEAEQEKEEMWGRGKNIYYQNKEYVEESSDEDLIAEEEAEVLRMQQKKAKSLSAADFGIEDDELTFEEILVQGKPGSAVSADGEAKNETGTAYEEVQKDLNALTKEEQMDVVYSSAPELVGLLSELGEALEQLDNKVNPLFNKINGKTMIKGGMHYIEVEKLLLLSYCQAISFYLLLKSEGQPVRDHPVISRLVEIKNLLNKMKELDGYLPSLEDLLHKNVDNVTGVKLAGRNLDSKSLPISDKPSVVSTDIQEAEPHEAELAELNGLNSQRKKESKRKRQDDQVGIQSMEMLKVRASLEEKLKQTGVLSSIARKNEKQNKRSRLLNGLLATPDDFDDDAMGAEDDRETRSLNKLSRLLTPQVARPKIISGDDDLPKRDDIGERRRKHELRVLAGAGVEPTDDVNDEPGDHASDDVATSDDSEMDSDMEFYREVEKQHSAKLAAKEKMYSRTPAMLSTPETVVDGKRQINYQMEKNRGLTRNRKKQDKNPRKKYRGKHEKAQKRREGQVQKIKKPSGPYGGETTGINVGISRSIRFKG